MTLLLTLMYSNRGVCVLACGAVFVMDCHLWLFAHLVCVYISGREDISNSSLIMPIFGTHVN